MKRFIQIVCIIVMIYSGVQLAKYVYTYFAVEKELEEVQQVVQNEELIALQDIYPNIVGWLTLDGTRLNNPAVPPKLMKNHPLILLYSHTVPP